jgi:hypothetical protein
MFGPQRDLGRVSATTSQPVDDAPPGDRHEPRLEWSAWIVGVAYGVERQENILHGVLDLAGQRPMPRGQGSQIRA